MKDLIKKLFLFLIQLAGGRPQVVLTLYWALEKATAGQNEILRQQSNRKIVISASAMRLITLVVAALGSVFLALAMVINPREMHPQLGVIVLVVLQYLVVSGLVISEAAPALLTEDDEKIIGWWPLTQREIHLARISILLRPALEVTLALSVLPLIFLLYTGKPPVLTALVFGLGLLIQAVGITFGVATLLLLIVRIWGRQTAERLGGMIAGGNHLFLIYPLMFSMDKIFPWFEAHPWLMYLFPPAWFAGWGDLTAGNEYRLLAVAGLLFTALAVWAGTRLAISSRSSAQVRILKSRPRPFAISGLISTLLRPMMRGEEGWALRKLLEAHLREDWRFIGSLMSIPFMLVVFGIGMGQSSACITAEDVQYSALSNVNMVMMLLFMGPLAMQTSHFSSKPEALWLLALADLKTEKILTAQRGMVRGLVFLPALAIYAIRANALGTAWHVILLDMAVLGVQLDLLMLIFQPWMAKMPFSTRYQKHDGISRIGLMMAVMSVSVVFMVASYFYAEVSFMRPVVWISLPGLWFFFRLRLIRMMKGRRLDTDLFSG